jgi:hypothetical protein
MWKPDLTDSDGPLNVLSLIQNCDKTLGGKNVALFFEEACEYSHPNYFGTIGLFGVQESGDGFRLQSDASCEHARDLAVTLIGISVQLSDVFLELLYPKLGSPQ